MQLNTFQQPFRGLQINRTHPLARDLIGYWICNDGTGKKVWDYSGNANQGTLEGTAPVWIAGGKGWAINFPGTDERIDCGNSAPLDQIGNGSFWISFWMKSKDVVPLAFSRMFSKDIDGNNAIDILSNNVANQIFFQVAKSGTVINTFFTNSNPFDATWHHLVLVANRTTDKALCYVDTVKDAVEGDLAALPADCSNAANIAWGALSGGARPYEGRLNKCGIYTGVPTQEIINWLYWEPYALFKSWRRRYQFFPDRIFLTFTGRTSGLAVTSQTPGLAVTGADMGLTITGDRG